MASHMRNRIALSAILVLSGVTGAAAQGVGRYQAIPLTKPNEVGTTVLIIDTETGNIWKWFEGGGFGSTPSGAGIVYEGAAVPGDMPGEIVARQGFGLPAIQRPAGK